MLILQFNIQLDVLISKIEKIIQVMLKIFGIEKAPDVITDLDRGSLLIFASLGMTTLYFAITHSFNIAINRDTKNMRIFLYLYEINSFIRDILLWGWLYLAAAISILISSVNGEYPYIKAISYNVGFLLGVVVTIWISYRFLLTFFLPHIKAYLLSRDTGL